MHDVFVTISMFDSLGPERWQKRYNCTSSLLQSPINIEKAIVVKDPSLGALRLSYVPSCNSTLTNDGRTLQLTIPKQSGKNSKCCGWICKLITAPYPVISNISVTMTLFFTFTFLKSSVLPLLFLSLHLFCSIVSTFISSLCVSKFLHLYTVFSCRVFPLLFLVNNFLIFPPYIHNTDLSTMKLLILISFSSSRPVITRWFINEYSIYFFTAISDKFAHKDSIT